MNQNPIDVSLPLPWLGDISAEQIVLWRAGMEWTLAVDRFVMLPIVPMPPPSEPPKKLDID